MLSSAPVNSVIILAFVKSEGKSTDKSSESEPESPTEHTSLLSERNSSLEGSLRERVVGGANIAFTTSRYVLLTSAAEEQQWIYSKQCKRSADVQSNF